MCLLAVFFAGSSHAADSSLVSLESSLSDLIRDISRSVVTVESSRSVPGDMLEGAADEAVHRLISSGTIIDSAGHILVAASTVAGYDRILVNFEDQQLPARLVGIDYHTGLALLSLDRPIGEPSRFTDRHTCVGQMVVAVGNAYGLHACATLGFCAGSRPDGSMQFSAAITPGTVGGGVFDLRGRLLGVVIGGFGQGRLSETGLAVPAHQLPSTVYELLTGGDRRAGYIGITTADIEISPGIALSAPYQLASSGAHRQVIVDRGTIVTQVVGKSPAAASGLRKGDLLFSIDKTPINSAFELMDRVRLCPPGGAIELGFIRHQRAYYVKLNVGQRELATVGDFAVGRQVDATNGLSREELYREVQRLKRSMMLLEKQLERLGP
ncbi:MAG: S1C family serine protease [candidate division Zixibacteria bacterium]|nr:S1C family serine protease [candidate division Zixibacteria bacterium]MDH3937158.1 S1C family serine protease [candidate division Zixibacteria bacterium]MDH4035188.1 S1C family serine protease [candidate division Zixibacteria bacterium]